MRLRRSRLTDGQTERLLQHYVAGTPARTAADLAGVNRNTARLFYHRMRELIAQHLARASPFEGKPEVDEACFAALREGERVRGSAGKVPLFGSLRRGDKVHAVMVLDAGRERPPGARTKVRPDSLVYTDASHVRKVLAVSGFRHQRVGPERPTRGRAPIDSIENFWNQAKRHLQRYNGIPRHHLHLFLKECEWRFNYGPPGQLLKTLKSWIQAASR